MSAMYMVGILSVTMLPCVSSQCHVQPHAIGSLKSAERIHITEISKFYIAGLFPWGACF